MGDWYRLFHRRALRKAAESNAATLRDVSVPVGICMVCDQSLRKWANPESSSLFAVGEDGHANPFCRDGTIVIDVFGNKAIGMLPHILYEQHDTPPGLDPATIERWLEN